MGQSAGAYNLRFRFACRPPRRHFEFAVREFVKQLLNHARYQYFSSMCLFYYSHNLFIGKALVAAKGAGARVPGLEAHRSEGKAHTRDWPIQQVEF